MSQAVELYAAGQSLTAIPTKLGIAWDSVARLLDRAGLVGYSLKSALRCYVTEATARSLGVPDSPRPRVPRPLYRRLGEMEIARLVAEYEGGATCTVLAQRYRVSESGVKQLLHARGARVRTPRSMSPAQIDQAVGLYEQGQFLREIGEELGFSQETVRRALLRRGLSMRSGHGNHGGGRG